MAAAPPTVLIGFWQKAQYPKGLAFSLPQFGQIMRNFYITTRKRELWISGKYQRGARPDRRLTGMDQSHTRKRFHAIAPPAIAGALIVRRVPQFVAFWINVMGNGQRLGKALAFPQQSVSRADHFAGDLQLRVGKHNVAEFHGQVIAFAVAVMQQVVKLKGVAFWWLLE